MHERENADYEKLCTGKMALYFHQSSSALLRRKSLWSIFPLFPFFRYQLSDRNFGHVKMNFCMCQVQRDFRTYLDTLEETMRQMSSNQDNLNMTDTNKFKFKNSFGCGIYWGD